MMLTLWSLHSKGARARDTEICLATSSGSKSLTVLPSSTRPARLIAPAASSRASVSEVLPVPPCPTRTTLRIRSVGNVFTRNLRGPRLGQAEQDYSQRLGTTEAADAAGMLGRC